MAYSRPISTKVLQQTNKMKVTQQKAAKNEQKSTEGSNKPKHPPYFQIKQYPHDGICQQLSFMLIRPPRFTYNPEMIKPNMRNSKRFTSQTVDIGFDLTLYRQKYMKYVVLYLHGNGSSRYQGNLFLHQLPDDVGLACFDFSGCGNRYESQYITLGQNQSKDVDIAAKYLKSKGYKVVGWGRSMGGASLLKSNELDIMVSDSAYSNLSQLCKESSSKFVPSACCCFFHALFPCVFACLKCKVESRSGLKINEMDIMGHLKKISYQAHRKQICFIHGKNDTLIPAEHAQRLHDSFNGRKKIILFDGTHNSTRPDKIINQCFDFIEEGLRTRKDRFPKNLNLEKMIEMEQIIIPADYNVISSPDNTPTTLKHSASNRSVPKTDKNSTYAHLNTQNASSIPITQCLQTEVKDDEVYQQGYEIQLIVRDTKSKPRQSSNNLVLNHKSGSQPNILNKIVPKEPKRESSKKKHSLKK